MTGDELIDGLTDLLVIAPDADTLREFIAPQVEGSLPMSLEEFLDVGRLILTVARKVTHAGASLGRVL